VPKLLTEVYCHVFMDHMYARYTDGTFHISAEQQEICPVNYSLSTTGNNWSTALLC